MFKSLSLCFRRVEPRYCVLGTVVKRNMTQENITANAAPRRVIDITRSSSRSTIYFTWTFMVKKGLLQQSQLREIAKGMFSVCLAMDVSTVLSVWGSTLLPLVSPPLSSTLSTSSAVVSLVTVFGSRAKTLLNDRFRVCEWGFRFCHFILYLLHTFGVSVGIVLR
ncbi:unnamed protein product [Ixodes pacificus]